MITLFLIDCQNDFITGTLTVKGAKNSIENIKTFIKNYRKDIDKIIFTLDWHPYNHSSFKKYGGIWPSHCVQHTPGACIEPKLLKYIQSLELDIEFVTKGEMVDVEQYGAFSEIELSTDDYPNKKYYFDSIATANVDSDFVVAGIAGDYCVKETTQNLINGGITPKMFLDGIASIDGGVAINEFIKENKLEKIV